MMMPFMGFNTVSGRYSGVGHGEKRHDNTNTPGRLLNEYAYISIHLQVLIASDPTQLTYCVFKSLFITETCV